MDISPLYYLYTNRHAKLKGDCLSARRDDSAEPRRAIPLAAILAT